MILEFIVSDMVFAIVLVLFVRVVPLMNLRHTFFINVPGSPLSVLISTPRLDLLIQVALFSPYLLMISLLLSCME